jgi:endonuclease/exonuclease/phosphatase family metal-dependent hydrolase
MPRIKLATFNCENLLMRCDFRAAGIAEARERFTGIDDPSKAERADALFNVLAEDDRTLTAQALAATGADVCALQEIENLVTLTAFDQRYLTKLRTSPFAERVLIEGNDQRGIDIGLLSDLAVTRVESHARASFGTRGLDPPPGFHRNDRIFRRDCLEVDVERDGRVLTLFLCHLKSMVGGRDATRPHRALEASAIRLIIEARFPKPAEADWIVLGDCNDFTEIDGRPVDDHGLMPLLANGFAIDLVPHRMADPLMRWTHHFPDENTYSALDHMLLSPRLAEQNPRADVRIIREGLPYRAERYDGFRFPGIGWGNPKASDHCPLAATLQFEGRALEIAQ